ncbi:alpha/beta hydrolase [Parendozoicomonas haliclonae]|uniref:Tropinesterase n=1 Tax=Parendozoicomonas haliclonae TaxID=1960125 RepID=A0A1X7AKL6_9GAMM|nr:alpha/beta hydrolase [Parendozoicomonas haliclonae]SMA47410.1 Tropinesterase [Parendozoicomonas haliclonae]
MDSSLTFTVSGQSFSALSWGDENAPVVLALHGWLDNAASFSRLAPQLEGMRIVAVDLAGHGHSDHRGVGADYPLWSHIPDVLAIADQLGLEKIHLLGHSMGAIIATMLAATVPERVASLTLIDGLLPAATPAEQTAEQLRKAVLWRNRKRNGLRQFASIEDAVRVRQTGFDTISADAAEIIVRRALKAHNEGWVWRSDPRLMAPTAQRLTLEQCRVLVEALDAPALLVTARDGFVDKALSASQELQKHLKVLTLEGDHHLHLEADTVAAVVKAISPHLQQVLNQEHNSQR